MAPKKLTVVASLLLIRFVYMGGVKFLTRVHNEKGEIQIELTEIAYFSMESSM